MLPSLNISRSASALRGRWRSHALALTCRLWLGAMLLLGVTAGSNAMAADEPMPVDFQVKAAFLVNFPKYVEWNPAVFPQTNSPITVAILGDENVANEFETMIGNGRLAGGRPLAVKRISSAEEITPECHIVFIGISERAKIPDILEKLKGAPVLTVSEDENFLEKGGVINLAHRNRKIRLQVNLGAAEAAGLKISSRLLMAADVVKGKPN